MVMDAFVHELDTDALSRRPSPRTETAPAQGVAGTPTGIAGRLFAAAGDGAP
jgi:hypothetical protein